MQSLVFPLFADRASIFGLLGVVTGLSVAIGPLLGGLIAERVSRHCVFQISTAVTMGNMVFVAKFLPESLPANKRNKEIMWHKARQLFFPRPIAPSFPVLVARACLWCLGARMWCVNPPARRGKHTRVRV